MSKNIISAKAILFSFFLFFHGYLSAQTTLYPTDDVYLYKGASGTGNEIRGMETTLNSYYNSAAPTYCRIIYLKFDLRTISSLIDSVKLRLYGTVNEEHGFDVYKTTLTGWNGDGLTYNNVDTEVGSVSISPIATKDVVGTGLTQYYDWDITNSVIRAIDSGESYLSLRLQDRYPVKTTSGSGIIVQFHSSENTSGNKPQLYVKYKSISGFELQELKVNGNLIADFASDKLKYTVTLPAGTTTIPTVTAVAQSNLNTINIENATNLTGTETERTTRIVSKLGSDSVVFKVVFELSADTDEVRLDSLKLNNVSLENFNKDSVYYLTYLPYTTTEAPVISGLGVNKFSTVSVTPASNIFGTSSAERTAKITVQSESGLYTKDYLIEFKVLPKLELFLALGQSNMSGRGYMVDSDYVKIPDVYLLTPAGNVEIATNPFNRYSSLEYMSAANRIGPACSFSKMMRDATGKSIGIMQNSKGGSSINSWLKGSSDGYYEEALRRANDIKKFGEIKGIIWHQGESDTSDPTGYKTKLLQLVTDFRTDLAIPNLFFIAGQIATWRSVAFSNMIATIQSFVPYSDWVSNEGLTPLIDTSDPHFDAPSQRTLGQRYAQKMLSNVYNIDVNTALKQISDEDVQMVKVLNDKIEISQLTDTCKLNIYNCAGKLVTNKTLQKDGTYYFSLTKGIYFVNISNKNDNLVKKIIL